jgi:hypothetical protein
MDCYIIIRKLLDSNLNIFPAFKHQWEIQTYTQDFSPVRLTTLVRRVDGLHYSSSPPVLLPFVAPVLNQIFIGVEFQCLDHFSLVHFLPFASFTTGT